MKVNDNMDIISNMICSNCFTELETIGDETILLPIQ